MKKKNYIYGIALLSLCTAGFAACSSTQWEDDVTEESARQTLPMNFIAELHDFDESDGQAPSSPTRATTRSWADGDKVYVSFYNGTSIIAGEATYASATGGWTVSCDESLPTGIDQKCEVHYFVNATFLNSFTANLNANTEIYEDSAGTYSYEGGTLTVKATLKPKTGRIRFVGTPGDVIHITGITTYTNYAPSLNTFSTSAAMVKCTVQDDGSTPYIYGFFTSEERRLGIVESDNAFTRICSAEMFNTPGESGYMNIPSESAHNSWRQGLYVKVNGVEFKMIPVVGYSGGFFLIGETEVTEELYEHVISSSSTSTSQLPKSGLSYDNINSFITTLNNTSNLHFKIPTDGEWCYAAQGGNMSQGYTYSGSNNVGDVAWYSGNSNSRQPVKQKAPNELGIYDMSGNVGEIVSEYYCNGGCFQSSAGGCQWSSGVSYYSSPSNYYRGFRLAMTCPN